MTNHTSRLAVVLDRIREAELRFQRLPGSVTLLAVSKCKPAAAITEVFGTGQTHFGENYLQEALTKIHALHNSHLVWHFIGPIQSNKTRGIAQNFHWVHSVENLKTAQRLSEQRPTSLPPLNLCLQVNISGEASKHGLQVDEVGAVAQAVAALPHLCLRGLMAIPAPCMEPNAQRRPYAELRKLQEDLISKGLPLDTLSMGMSDDLEAAIAEGATIVRVGTAIFGPRQSSEGKNQIGNQP